MTDTPQNLVISNIRLSPLVITWGVRMLYTVSYLVVFSWRRS